MDDHRAVRDSVSALLSEDFDIVGSFGDGRQAAAAATELAPDLIVLDVNMPGIDGFDTKRALDQAGSRAPVVFLSMAETDDYVAAAFRHGARGYVVKSRLARDLAGALDQVRRGRVFMPSLIALSDVASGGGHAMQLHGGIDRFLEGVAALFERALRRGDATCVIATPEIREGLARRLHEAGWDVGGPSGHERFLSIDADAAISRFMRDGLPDPAIVTEIASELDAYRRAVSPGPLSRVTIFGNMVVPLITRGNPGAALALEQQWHQLTEGRPFLTVCGYHSACFHDGAPHVWPGACQAHWAVSHTRDI